jgi:hypothetical protein
VLSIHIHAQAGISFIITAAAGKQKEDQKKDQDAHYPDRRDRPRRHTFRPVMGDDDFSFNDRLRVDGTAAVWTGHSRI